MDAYLSALEDSVDEESGRQVATALSVRTTAALVPALRSVDVERECKMRFAGDMGEWAPLVAGVLKGAKARQEGDMVAAATAELGALGALNRLLYASATNWLVEPLKKLCFQVRDVSAQADAQVAAGGGSETEHQENLSTTLRQSFSYTLNHRVSDKRISKKWGVIYVTNTLFRLYFNLNNLRQCDFLIHGVNMPGGIPLESYPVAQQVTYNFYTGRISVYKDELGAADVALTAALRRCHKDHFRNRRTILKNLVPVRLHFGHLPSVSLLTKYRLEYYVPIVQAIRTGNIRLFNEAMRSNRALFIQNGVYLLLEKLELYVYRTLFKQILAATGNPVMKLLELQGPLEHVGVELDLDEIECMLANLIANKLARGYISHKHRAAVFSKENAFPNIAGVMDKRR